MQIALRFCTSACGRHLPVTAVFKLNVRSLNSTHKPSTQNGRWAFSRTSVPLDLASVKRNSTKRLLATSPFSQFRSIRFQNPYLVKARDCPFGNSIVAFVEEEKLTLTVPVCRLEHVAKVNTPVMLCPPAHCCHVP